MTAALKNKAELLLALLVSDQSGAAVPTAVVGITRLEKLLFLLKIQERLLRDVQDTDDFHFVPFRMGPWTNEVYDEVDFLESLGLVDKKTIGDQTAADAAHDDELFSEGILDKYQKQSTASDEETEVFSLTEKGRKKALEIWQRLPEEDRRKLTKIKRQFNKMSLRQLLRYVYTHFPEYTTESEIKQSLGL